MKKTGVRVLREDKQQIEGDLVLKESKIYVLKDKALRVEIIQLHYGVLIARHGGKWKTMELVTRNYQQPVVTRDVGKYVESCDICSKMKNRTEELAGKLKLNKILKKLWTHLMVDFIMVTIEGTSVEELVWLFRDNI